MRFVSPPSGRLLWMSRATSPPPVRPLAALAAVLLVVVAAALGAGAVPAQAAKPCWERVLDDWSDNGQIEGNYSTSCLIAARKHVPEDLRTYTDVLDKIDGKLHGGIRTPQGVGTSPGPAGPAGTNRARGPQLEPNVEDDEDGPIPSVLGTGTNDASSIPIPLLVLAGLALLLMAAGGAGFAHRKLQARRVGAGDK
jgi:hypothetical protein